MRLFTLALTSMMCLTSCSSSSLGGAPLMPQSTQALQCHTHADCEGDRICESGQCRNPSSVDVTNASSEFSARNEWRAPTFTDYPVDRIYSGPPARLVMDNDTARDYRTQFNKNLERDPSFAGEYIDVQWGCGTQCGSQHFINKRTGRVLEDSFGGECGELIEGMRVDSRLIITKGPVCDDDYNEIDFKVKFYVLEDIRLELIAEKSIPRPVGAYSLPSTPVASDCAFQRKSPTNAGASAEFGC